MKIEAVKNKLKKVNLKTDCEIITELLILEGLDKNQVN